MAIHPVSDKITIEHIKHTAAHSKPMQPMLAGDVQYLLDLIAEKDAEIANNRKTISSLLLADVKRVNNAQS